MSVFVKDMQMPSGCGSCDFANFFSDGEPYCRRLMKRVKASSRLPDCPISAVPDVGDLVRRDWLRKRGYYFPCAIGTEYAIPLRAVLEAPTIIPADPLLPKTPVNHGSCGATTKEEAMKMLGLEPDKEDTNT